MLMITWRETVKVKYYARIATGAALAVFLTGQVQASGASGMGVSEDMLQELKRMIEKQQAQLDQQSAEIAELKERLAGTNDAIDTKADKDTVAGNDKMVTSSKSNVNVGLYGHVNRALLYVKNGDTSKWYSVDNSNSQSRFGLNAVVDTGTGWEIGGRIEYGIFSNSSSAVNNENTNSGSGFNLRWAEANLKNDMYGKVSLGLGDTASNNIAEVDLSGTTVASYSSISDMAGGSLWYESGSDFLTDVRIGQIYNDIDGLSRRDRIRYDTPSFAGVTVSGSMISGDAFDAAVNYNRKFGETKVAAALGAANPGDIIVSADNLIAGSISVLFPMGFNATFSSGYLDFEDNDRDNATNWWGKLGYQTRFTDSGLTSFSIDYGETARYREDDETGKTWAIAAVHNMMDWGTEVYLAYRGHSLDSQSLMLMTSIPSGVGRA